MADVLRLENETAKTIIEFERREQLPMFLVRTALTDVRRSLVTTSDYIVIGAGLAGTATAWHLANRGKQVTMLERAEPGNTEGSSHGSANLPIRIP